ncbi:DUF559 domain-containing protein [Asticcacaulis sp. SL142]|uniref:DUF559 domain-containing protein n=1 Tax=Asticcacaulis sp. SL142 TaxID=2995155 RepID=UPI00226D0451|nr:DUF559 domain-containing protein [Asticcacaulis sp. SL142]WAC49714.1 DUF559 domain-containing protein [Asticcacaulis sp. SL142]
MTDDVRRVAKALRAEMSLPEMLMWDGMAHDIGDRPERDIQRDKWLNNKGLEVYRVAARDVLADPEEAVEGIVIVTLNRLNLLAP